MYSYVLGERDFSSGATHTHVKSDTRVVNTPIFLERIIVAKRDVIFGKNYLYQMRTRYLTNGDPAKDLILRGPFESPLGA